MDTTVNTHNIDGLNKPASVRIIFILNAFKILLAFALYFVFTTRDISIGGADPSIILYTAFGYIILFGAMVYSILNRKVWGLRASIILDFLVSIPATAIAGFLISIISFIVSYRKSAKAYFEYKG